MYTVEFNNQIKTLMHPVKTAGISAHQGIIEASNTYEYKVHVNQRHAHFRNLPEQYQNYPKYVILREPHSWYESFYNFFINVEGYLSFMLNDPKDDGYIYPIDINEFVRRSINFKDTLIKFPNKARVFRNLLRSQGNMHFITSYFEGDFHPEDEESMKQFDCSLFEWFMRPMGYCNVIPMKRLDIVEREFGIKMPHANKTNNKIAFIDEETKELIKETHSHYYELLENFDENNLREINFETWRKI